MSDNDILSSDDEVDGINISTNLPLGNECSICLDSPNLPFTLECNHTFCYLCIKRAYISSNKLCPLCRHPIPREIYEHAKLQKELHHSNNTIKWLYKGRQSGWWEYDNITSELIEDAYNSNKQLILVNILGSPYIIDLRKWKQILTITPFTERQIKRVDTSNELAKNIKGIAGLKMN